MLKSFICLGVVSLLWVTIGFSLSFGAPIGFTINDAYYGIIGNPLDFTFFDQVEVLPHKSLAPTIPFILFALFQMKFAVITPAIITGALAERIRFISFLLFMSTKKGMRKSCPFSNFGHLTRMSNLNKFYSFFNCIHSLNPTYFQAYSR